MKKIVCCFALLCLLISCRKDKTSETKGGDESLQTEQKLDTLTFTWNSDLCQYKGYYLASLYTPREVQNTFDLSQGEKYMLKDVLVFSPQDIDEIDIPALSESYRQLVHFLDTCKTIDSPFWQSFKAKEKLDRKKEYELTKILGQAYTDPSVLLNNPYVDKHSECYKYAKALNAPSVETLLDVWEAWANESKKKNGNPEAYMQKFYSKYNAADDLVLIYARIDLLTFAWWNCVNKSIEYPNSANLEEEFKKLFVCIETIDCDEP